MKTKILGLLAVGLLAGPTAAQAVIITLDNPHQTVVRPAGGTIQVQFTGTLTNADGENLGPCGVVQPYIGLSDDRLSVGLPSGDECKTLGSALRFFVEVTSTSVLGSYANRYGTLDLPFFRIAVLSSTGAFVRHDTATYSVTVVDRLTVPEPGSLALLGLGLVGLGLSRRRKAD